MAAPLEDMVMSAFEDLIQLSQDEKNEIQREIDSSENEFDESTLKPMDASSLAKHELDAELEKRGIHPKGFKSDDEKTLQAKINEEFGEYVIKLRKEFLENKERLKNQAYVTRRRMLLETKLREEQQRLHEDSRLNFLSSLVRQSSTSPQMRIPMDSISARSFAKNIYDNTSLIALDVSNLLLDDLAGSFLARMLRNNNVLEKLEMQGNCFGPITCLSLANSLKYNVKLNHLNLSNNPLTKEGSDTKSFILLCKTLCGENPIEVIKPNPEWLEQKKREEEKEEEYQQNGYVEEEADEEIKEEKAIIPETITEYIQASVPSIETFNIHKCFVGDAVGPELINTLIKAPKLLFVDCSYNDFSLPIQHKLSMNIECNFKNHYHRMESRQADMKILKEEQDERQRITEKMNKDEELRSWLEEERQMRISTAIKERQEEIKKEKAKRIEEEKAEEERREKERLAKMEADAKKAAKGKKKGK